MCLMELIQKLVLEFKAEVPSHFLQLALALFKAEQSNCSINVVGNIGNVEI